MIKAKTWKGNNLKGTWHITLKVDGVRALSDGTHVVSRNGKKLHNLDHLAKTFVDAEVYAGTFADSVSAVKMHNGPPVPAIYVFSLSPKIDKRLDMGRIDNPDADCIRSILRQAETFGYEGVVLRQGDVWIKVVSRITYDVRVTGVLAGRGKHTGTMGALACSRGLVGTGFTDKQRAEFNNLGVFGRVMEVEAKGLTSNGMFRQPSFVRFRDDK